MSSSTPSFSGSDDPCPAAVASPSLAFHSALPSCSPAPILPTRLPTPVAHLPHSGLKWRQRKY